MPEGLTADQILGEDGAFVDNWRDEAFPGDDNKEIRSNPTLANIKDVRSLARQVISGESQIGKLTSGRDFAILPNEHSTPEELNAFHTKMGRPKTAPEYEFSKAEGADPKFATHMENALHAVGASKAVADAALKGYMAYSVEQAAAQETEDKIADAKADKELRTKLGSQYDATIAQGNLAINALAAPIDPAWAAQLAKEMPFDVNATQFFAKIGALIAEDKGLTQATGQTGFTPSDARAKANQVMAENPYYISETPMGPDGTQLPRNKAKHDAAVQEVADLLKMANA